MSDDVVITVTTTESQSQRILVLASFQHILTGSLFLGPLETSFLNLVLDLFYDHKLQCLDSSKMSMHNGECEDFHKR